jgi:transcriptional regulator with XRE-family HTH domain
LRFVISFAFTFAITDVNIKTFLEMSIPNLTKNKFCLYMDENVILSGSRLKSARKSLDPKMTQEEVAQKFGVTRVTYNMYEGRENVELSPKEAAKLAQILQVGIEDLVKTSEIEKEENVKNVKSESIDNLTFEKYDQAVHALIESQQRHIEQIEKRTAEEVKRLNEYNLFLQDTVRDLTKGLASLKNT